MNRLGVRQANMMHCNKRSELDMRKHKTPGAKACCDVSGPGCRAVIVLLTIIFVLSGFTAISQAETYNWPKLDELQTSAYLVADLDSGEVILSHQADLVIYPASTTKIMTSLLLIESDNLDDQTIVSEAAVNLDYDMARTGFLAGETVVLEDVLYSLMLASGNDSARVTAEYIAGDTAAFADLMNQRAAELGLEQTNFMNPSGLHDPAHVTTAEDMLLLTRYAMQSQQFREVVQTDKYVMPATNLHPYHAWAVLKNSNELLHFGELAYASPYFKGYTGIKTGTTRAAGYCLAATALTHDDRELLLLLFGVPIDEPRSLLFQTAYALFQAAAEQADLPEAVPVPTGSPQPATPPATPDASETTQPSSSESTQPQASATPTDTNAPADQETAATDDIGDTWPYGQQSEQTGEAGGQVDIDKYEALARQNRFWQVAFFVLLLVSLGAALSAAIYIGKKHDESNQ